MTAGKLFVLLVRSVLGLGTALFIVLTVIILVNEPGWHKLLAGIPLMWAGVISTFLCLTFEMEH